LTRLGESRLRPPKRDRLDAQCKRRAGSIFRIRQKGLFRPSTRPLEMANLKIFLFQIASISLSLQWSNSEMTKQQQSRLLT
jgi:hypothetical protein